MKPAEAHELFGEILKRSRKGAIAWQLKKEKKEEPRCVDYAAPADDDGSHAVEIGSEHVEEHGVVYEFRVLDEAGMLLYEYALSLHTAVAEKSHTYEMFVELFTLAKNRAVAHSRGR